MKRMLGILVLLTVAAHPAKELDDAAALQVAIELLEREGKTAEAAHLTAMLERLPPEVPEEADPDQDHKRRVQSLFDFFLAWDRVDPSEVEEQERQLAQHREAARKALEAGDYESAAEATQDAAATARELEANRLLLRAGTKRPASSSNTGLVSRLRRIEQRLDRMERLIRTRLR